MPVPPDNDPRYSPTPYSGGQHYPPRHPPGPVPPPGTPRKSSPYPWIFGGLAVLVVALFFVLIAVVALTPAEPSERTTSAPSTSDGAVAEAAKSRPNRTPTAGTAARPELIPMNDAASDGDFTFTVTGAESGLTQVGDSFLVQKAQGQFVVVTVRVRNDGSKAASFSPADQILLDEKDREFETDTTAQIALNDNDIAVWDKINPGNTATVKLVFDVPASAVPTAIELHDRAFGAGVTVSLK